MRSVLIYHENDRIDSKITAPWLGSFTELAGMVILREDRNKMFARSKREIRRVGLVRFLDVIAFRLYYRVFQAAKDELLKEKLTDRIGATMPALSNVPTIVASSPNSEDVEDFIKSLSPDVMVARCKVILTKSIFSIPSSGTYVLHPGICPEYRNAHGCFWAIAEDDLSNVGLTLLRVDEGIDTGPIYGYFSYDFDFDAESHVMIQTKVFTENLERIKTRLVGAVRGSVDIVDVSGRKSRVWGHPWLSKFLQAKRRAWLRKKLNKSKRTPNRESAARDGSGLKPRI